MDLSIIIVNWNSKEFLRKCVGSILAHTDGIRFEVVVIDSASFDGSDKMLSEEFPGVRFIQSVANIGFARANNWASRETTGKYLLFLNPDTEVVGSAIRALYLSLESQPQVGIVGAKLLNSDGSVQTSCIQSMPTLINKVLDSDLLRSKWPTSKLWGMAPLFREDPKPSEVDAVSGACLMIKAAVFRRVDGFSDDFFMYAEDIDLARKVQQAGYRNYYVPTATVVHHGGNSSAQAPSAFATIMMSEATRRFFLKTRGPACAAAYRIGIGFSALVRLALLLVARLSGCAIAGNNNSSLQKWQALLQWSLKQDTLVRKYYPISDR